MKVKYTATVSPLNKKDDDIQDISEIAVGGNGEARDLDEAKAYFTSKYGPNRVTKVVKTWTA